MLKKLLLTAVRYAMRNKTITYLNVLVLTVGIACFILISMWVMSEFSFDNFHSKKDNIFRVVYKNEYVACPNATGPYFRKTLPEIKEFARIFNFPSVESPLVTYKKKKFYEKNILVADPSFFNIFSFPLIRGDANNPFPAKNSVILTSGTAAKYFGNKDPIDKVLTVEGLEYSIKGIIENIPHNSHLQFDFLFNSEDFESGYGLNSWENWSSNTYYLLENKADIAEVGVKITDTVWNEKVPSAPKSSRGKWRLQALSDIHLKSNFQGSKSALQGSMTQVSIFILAALIILGISVINYINMSVSTAIKRMKEIGIRRLAGATRKAIAMQYLIESTIITVCSVLLSLVIVDFLLPKMNSVLESNLDFSMLLTHSVLLPLIFIVFTVPLLSVIFPAIIFSKQSISNLFRSKSPASPGGIKTRKILVFVQFSLLIGLIIFMIVAIEQINYIQNRDLGFSAENVVSVSLNPEITERLTPFKNEILKNSAVVDVTATDTLFIGDGSSTGGVTWTGKDKDESVIFNFRVVDENYLNTMGMEMAEGRFFKKELSSERERAFIINETALREMDIRDPLKKEMSIFGSDNRKIIGVLKDFHQGSLLFKVKPMVLFVGRDEHMSYLLVKMKPSKDREVLGHIEKVWKNFSSENPLKYDYIDSQIGAMYISDQKTLRMLYAFTITGIFLASLGILNLAIAIINIRRKEVSIRKVLGATISRIYFMLVKDFTRDVLMANIIAWPVAYYFANDWLERFSYRISLDIFIFFISGFTGLVIALFVISYLTIRLARENPVWALKDE